MHAFDASKEEKLEALRRRLLERLPGMLADIASACRDAVAAPGDAGRFERAVRACHTMAGTAGTYGFFAIGEISHDLEKLLRGSAPLVARDVEVLLAQLREFLPAGCPAAALAPARMESPEHEHGADRGGRPAPLAGAGPGGGRMPRRRGRSGSS